ncbi:MAG: protein-L-isoaspartate(D-aspartate) O-methyltransferase [Gemmatimonadota bacterium]
MNLRRTSNRASFEAQREAMVERQIRRRGIGDPIVLAAMAEVPRHLFVPPARRKFAYSDRALGLGPHSTISQPYIVARMTAALDLAGLRETSAAGGEVRVLEIGTGSGYQSAVLAACGCRVFSIEREAGISNQAAANLEEAGYAASVELRIGDGSLGWPEESPFDAILVTAGAQELPPALLAQLAATGVLVAPLGPPSAQVIRRGQFEKGELLWQNLEEVRFVPLRSGGGFGDSSER